MGQNADEDVVLTHRLCFYCQPSSEHLACDDAMSAVAMQVRWTTFLHAKTKLQCSAGDGREAHQQRIGAQADRATVGAIQCGMAVGHLSFPC